MHAFVELLSQWKKINLACGLFQILESVEFNKKTKMSTAKPTEFSCILKVSKQQLGTKPYQVRRVFTKSVL